MFRTTSRALWLAIPWACVLYLWGLGNIGLVSTDEPRYAAIGREMAQSGDWITPRLWGAPWFEKPALLYWMTGAGFRLGLSEELAPRLPVAICGAAFLAFFFWILRREFDQPAAWFATAVLGTSAGWLAYSHVAVTDLPMSAAFSAAMFLAMPWLQNGDRRRLPLVAALLALAVLAKGLVPLVLALPLVWMGRKHLIDWFRPSVAGTFLTIGLPWYVLCYVRNGWPFIEKLFWEQHFQRITSDALQHGQPFWYYLPVVAAAIFPWTPALILLFQRPLYKDVRLRFFLTWILFGLLFFSVAANKLPGYTLPLLPAMAALCGRGSAGSRHLKWVLGAATALLALIPVVAAILPSALAGGITRADWPAWQWTCLIPLIAAAAVWKLAHAQHHDAALLVTVAAITVSILYLERQAFPAIDQLATARPLWREVSPVRDRVCVAQLHRGLRYGLNYYSVTPLPDCAAHAAELEVRQQPGRPPHLTPAAIPLYPRTE
jgi:4-amino-4-deoxy-L-arabinose transferase-like glycosyltransferase